MTSDTAWPRLAVTAAVCCAASLAAPGSARAAEPQGTDVSALLTEAVAEYDAGRYEEARALFRRAHQIAPSARTLRGIGMASFELRDYVQAVRSLETSLKEERKPLTPEQRQHVETLIERASAYVGRIVLDIAPREAAVRVDGRGVTLDGGGTLLLGFGAHSILVEAPGHLPERRDVQVLGGERMDLSFQLKPAEAAAQPPQPADRSRDVGGAASGEAGVATPIAVRDEPQAAGGGGRGRVLWFAGAGALAVGAVAGVLWVRQLGGEIDRCRDAGAACVNGDALDGRHDLALGLTIGLGVGAAALATAGAILWSRKATPSPAAGSASGSSSASTAALSCNPGLGTVSCAITF